MNTLKLLIDSLPLSKIWCVWILTRAHCRRRCLKVIFEAKSNLTCALIFRKNRSYFWNTSRRGAAHGCRLESRDKIMGQRAGQRQFLNDWYFLSNRITVDCRLIFTYDVVLDMPTSMSAPACARFNWELLFVQLM